MSESARKALTKRWRSKAARQRQSEKVRRTFKRKYRPTDAELPRPARTLERMINDQNQFITVITILPRPDQTYPENSWVISAHDPEPVLFAERWERYLTTAGFEMKRLYGDPMMFAPGYRVMAVVVPKS